MIRLSANFTSDEFKCPCCGKVDMSSALILKLQDLRYLINKPIKISSGYRCSTENKKIGGYSKSPHLLGKAADIRSKHWLPSILSLFANRIKGIRIGIYPNHLHIDIMPPNPSKYWLVKKYGDKPIYSKREKNLAKFLKKNL